MGHQYLSFGLLGFRVMGLGFWVARLYIISSGLRLGV